MCDNFCIHSSVDGQLGCFHVLAIINSAGMNIGVHVSLSLLVSSVCMPSSGRGRGWGDLGEWHWNMYNIICEMSCQSRFDARYWMLGAGALGWPRGMVSCMEPLLAICFTYDIIHVSMPFSQIIPPLPSPTESKRLFYTSVSFLLPSIQGYHYHFLNSIYMR